MGLYSKPHCNIALLVSQGCSLIKSAICFGIPRSSLHLPHHPDQRVHIVGDGLPFSEAGVKVPAVLIALQGIKAHSVGQIAVRAHYIIAAPDRDLPGRLHDVRLQKDLWVQTLLPEQTLLDDPGAVS